MPCSSDLSIFFSWPFISPSITTIHGLIQPSRRNQPRENTILNLRKRRFFQSRTVKSLIERAPRTAPDVQAGQDQLSVLHGGLRRLDAEFAEVARRLETADDGLLRRLRRDLCGALQPALERLDDCAEVEEQREDQLDRADREAARERLRAAGEVAVPGHAEVVTDVRRDAHDRRAEHDQRDDLHQQRQGGQDRAAGEHVQEDHAEDRADGARRAASASCRRTTS